MSAKSMRIGIDVQWATNFNTGIGKYTNKWIGQLAELDSDNHYFLFGWGRLGQDSDLTRALSTNSNFSYVDIDPNSLVLPYRLAMVLRDQWALPQVAKKYRCSFLFYPYFNPSVLCLSKSIVTITDLDLYLHRQSYPFARQAYYNFLLRLAARHALAFVVISESTKSDAVHHLGIAPDRIHVIYPGLAEQFRPVDRYEAQHWCAEHYNLTKPFVLYSGGYAVRKNTARMLAAFARARHHIDSEIQLVLTGEAQKDPVVRSYLSAEGKGHLVVLGKIPEEELPFLYSAAQAVLYVSLYEGFGLPIVEAQACGTPVITSNVSSMPEIAGDAALMVNPLDEGAIATAIVRILSDRGLREYLQARGLQNAKRFTWRAGAEKLLDLFKYYGERNAT